MSSDPYVYPGTTVLKNIPGIRNQEILDRFEADRVGQRSLELIERPLPGLFDIEHLQGIHRFLFQDVYAWCPYRKLSQPMANKVRHPSSGNVQDQSSVASVLWRDADFSERTATSRISGEPSECRLLQAAFRM